MTRWLWTSRRTEAKAARLLLLPVSGLWLVAVRSRSALYRFGVLERRRLPVPSVAVGNLTLGASGQTAVTRWIARYFAELGVVPGIVHGGTPGLDAAAVRHVLPSAVVSASADRRAASQHAAAEGAQVLILDDAFQRHDFRYDLRIAVLAAESGHAVPWTVPAGPWREPFGAVAGADAVVITRRRATSEAAADLAGRARAAGVPVVAIAALDMHEVEGLVTGRRQPADALAGKRVVAASGTADPDQFGRQVKATGAAVQVAGMRDPVAWRDEDVAWLAQAARKADHVVIPERDAARLRDRWPSLAPEPLVALSDPAWDTGEEGLRAALAALVRGRSRPDPTQ